MNDAAPFLLHAKQALSSADACNLEDLKMEARRAERATRRFAPRSNSMRARSMGSPTTPTAGRLDRCEEQRGP